MYPGKTRPREKPNKTLLEKIFIMKPCTIMNHAFNLQNQTKDTGLDKAPSSDLQSQKPNSTKQCARSKMISSRMTDDNDTMSEETLLLIDLQIQ